MITVFFTDIEGSTRSWEQNRQRMAAFLVEHDAILRDTIPRFGGRIVTHTGDGVFAVFEGGAPFACAIACQAAFQGRSFESVGEVRIRVAIHAGEAELRDNNYFGPAVNRAHRVLTAAWGGQILVTAEAVRAHEVPPGARLRDLGAHVLRDVDQPIHLYCLTSPALGLTDFPAPRSVSARPHNLPKQTTTFVGRKRELARIASFLGSDECRLLTLLGPGGMGKTRLSLHAAVLALGGFADGIWFVPLAGVTSPGQIAVRIAEAMRFGLLGTDDPLAQLRGYLSDKSLLVVLDNFEHVTAHAGVLADLLDAAPGLKIVVTSRERLDLEAEQIVEVEGLEYPRDANDEAFDEHGAVKLFVEAARRARPDFALRNDDDDDEDREALVSICRVVDGMPLGLELAAVWTRGATVREIAKRIANNLGSLSSTRRDLPERHRSIRAVFDHSYNLLSDVERTAIARLSVFRGGFTLEAAEEIADAEPGTLLGLVDKSQLVLDASGRYQIHGVVRQLAGERLDAAPGERDRVLDRHAGYYAALLEACENDMRASHQRRAVQRIRTELANVRQAWQNAIDQRRFDRIAQAAETLGGYYEVTGSVREGIDAMETARAVLERPEGSAALRARGKVLAALMLLYHIVSAATARGNAYAVEAETIFRGAGYKRELGYLLAMAHLYGRADPGAAFVEGIAIFEEIGDANGRALCLQNLGQLWQRERRLDESERMLEEALAIFQSVGNERQEAWSHFALADLAETRGDIDACLASKLEGLRCFEQLDDPNGIGWSLSTIGWLLVRHGQYDRAEPYLERGLAVFRHIGNQTGIQANLRNLAEMKKLKGGVEDADEVLH